MNSKIARINSEIERRTAEIINNKLSDPRLKGGLISVTSARTTSDLKFAKVYVSMLNIDDVKGALKVLNDASGFVRKMLQRRLVFQSLLSRTGSSAKMGLPGSTRKNLRNFMDARLKI